jgi:hypothetical protein
MKRRTSSPSCADAGTPREPTVTAVRTKQRFLHLATIRIEALSP